MKRVDLHIHTTASDGTSSPEEIPGLAKECGLYAIAITDHDTVDGCRQLLSSGVDYGIEIVPGIELSTKYEGPCHILGYYIDTDNSELCEELDGIVRDRDARNAKIVEIMREDGISITYEEMKSRFGDVVGRPHIAEILVENGLVPDINTAFSTLLSKGMKYWQPRTTLSPERCISLIKQAGGIPVLAHPFEYKYNSKTLAGLIEFCIDAGIEGIECRHSSHSPGQMAYLELLADEYGLLKTGGSDYHGNVKPDISIGTGTGIISVPYNWLENLKARVN